MSEVVQEECLRVKKQLERENERLPMVELLTTLEGLMITRDILKVTMIGKTVNTVYKTQVDPVVREKARNLVLKWKSVASVEKGDQPTVSRHDSCASVNSQTQQSQQTVASASSITSFRGASGTPGSIGGFPDKVRYRRIEIRRKLAQYLKIETSDLDDSVKKDLRCHEEVATDLEEELWAQLVTKGGDEKQYNTQLRSIIFNLKDPKNPNFNYKILTGFLKPDIMPKMPAEKMASESKQAERAKFRQDSMEEIQTDWALRHGEIRISGMFTCGKCKGTSTTYFQMQTRSADEPMTTFVTCINCNNRWKFC